jgi:Ca-activated chloride channel family protein
MADSGGRLDTRVDLSMLRRVSSEAGVSVVRAAAGDGDITAVMRAIDSNLRQANDPEAQWRDAGWWFLWPALLLALPWFRRGWTMQW